MGMLGDNKAGQPGEQAGAPAGPGAPAPAEEEQVDTEADLQEQKRRYDKMMKVLSGHLKDLPPLSKKVMRIFTSSTFTGKPALLHAKRHPIV